MMCISRKGLKNGALGGDTASSFAIYIWTVVLSLQVKALPKFMMENFHDEH